MITTSIDALLVPFFWPSCLFTECNDLIYNSEQLFPYWFNSIFGWRSCWLETSFCQKDEIIDDEVWILRVVHRKLVYSKGCSKTISGFSEKKSSVWFTLVTFFRQNTFFDIDKPFPHPTHWTVKFINLFLNLIWLIWSYIGVYYFLLNCRYSHQLKIYVLFVLFVMRKRKPSVLIMRDKTSMNRNLHPTPLYLFG